MFFFDEVIMFKHFPGSKGVELDLIFFETTRLKPCTEKSPRFKRYREKRRGVSGPEG